MSNMANMKFVKLYLMTVIKKWINVTALDFEGKSSFYLK